MNGRNNKITYIVSVRKKCGCEVRVLVFLHGSDDVAWISSQCDVVHYSPPVFCCLCLFVCFVLFCFVFIWDLSVRLPLLLKYKLRI